MATSRMGFDEVRRIKREDEYDPDEGACLNDGDDKPEMGRLEYLVRAVIVLNEHD